MFDKLHLLSQDVPEGGDGLRWRAHPYLRLAGAVPRGPAVFDWSARQREDLEALWREPAADGARERLARDLAAFADKLGWAPDTEVLADAEQHGDEYLVTLSAVPPELYALPWEVIQVGASGTYLSDYASAQVRYAVPGLEPREILAAPPKPGVLFAWSGAGGAVPHEDQAAAIRGAAEAGGVGFHELAGVDEASLQAALDAGPPSVLHLLCHGLPGPEGEPPRLRWGASDSPSEITATQLARMLRRHHGAIRLVVLSACGSGDGHTDPLFMTSLAQELHKKGIPSVVASRYPLSVPGSRVMTRALYGKMLREAWSLERALRHAREALFRVDDGGEAHPGDAYGIQLYAYDRERFTSDNDVEAERPVLASYPFGTAARPVPASAPPATELTLGLDVDSPLSEQELVDRLRLLSEDATLTVAIPLGPGRRDCALIVRTTVDGAQRLLGAWRSKTLQVAIGVAVGELILSKVIMPAVKGLFASAKGKAGAGGKAAARAKSATAAGKGSAAVARVGTAGQAASVAQAASVGQIASVSAGKTAMAAAAITGKAITTKIAVAALISSVAAAGGAMVYRAQAQPSAPVQAAADSRTNASEPRPRIAPGPLANTRPTVYAPEPPVSPVEPPPSEPSAPSPSPVDLLPDKPSAPSPKPTERPPSGAPEATPTATMAQDVATTTPPPITTTVAQGNAEPQPTSAPQPTTNAAPAPAITGAPPDRGVESASAGTGLNGDRASTASTRTDPVANRDCRGDPDHAGSGDPSAACTDNHGNTPATQAVCGDGTLGAGEQCDDGNTRDGDGCSSTCMKEVVATSPVTVKPSALRDQRISGDSNVPISKRTRDAMIRNHMTSLKAVVRLCVDTTGLVTDSTLIERTGYTEYDSNIIETIHAWQYRPYLINGTPTLVCSTEEFIYSP